MRKILAVALVASMLGACGCGLSQKQAECGWRFEVMKPPIIHTTTPVIVQANGGEITAQSVGSVSGPVVDGSWSHGSMRANVKPAPVAFGTCGPESLTPRFTAEEWCRMQGQSYPLPMPRQVAIPNPCR